MKQLTEIEKSTLYKALFYLSVSELKSLCTKLAIQPHGEKIDLIENIQQFITTGKPTTAPIMPSSSKAQSKKNYPLAPETLILYGNFKNDLKTRIFLKSLIGNHFHYTAFGIDWIKTHWLAGTPPTYQQFANYWQQEFSHRQIEKPAMKPEWAYLNFVDQYKKDLPYASKTETIYAWKIYREKQVNLVKKILNL